MGDFQFGKVKMPVEPDTTGFRRQLATETKTAAEGVDVKVKAEPDISGFTASLKRMLKAQIKESGIDVSIPVNLKIDRQQLKTDIRFIQAQVSAQNVKLELGVTIPKSAVTAELRRVRDVIKAERNVEIVLTPVVLKKDIAAAIRDLKAFARAEGAELPLRPTLNANKGAFIAEVRAFISEIQRSIPDLHIGVKADTGAAIATRAAISRSLGDGKDINHIDDKLKQLAKTAGAITGPLGGVGSQFARLTQSGSLLAAGIGGLGVAFAGIIGYGAKVAADAQLADKGIVALTKSLGFNADQSANYIKQLENFAAVTPFEVPQIKEATKFLIGAGTAAEDVLPLLTRVTDVGSVLGATTENIENVARALAKVRGKGTAQLLELNQIRRNLPGFDPVKAIADFKGQSLAETYSQISKKAIPASVAIEAINQGLEKFPGAAGASARAAETLSGRFSTLKDNVAIGFKDAFLQPEVEKPLNDLLKSLADNARSQIGEGAKALAPIITAFGPALESGVDLFLDLTKVSAPFFAQLLDGAKILTDRVRPAIVNLGPAFDALGNLVIALAPLLATVTNLMATGLAPAAKVTAIALEAATPAIELLAKLLDSLPGPLQSVIGLMILFNRQAIFTAATEGIKALTAGFTGASAAAGVVDKSVKGVTVTTKSFLSQIGPGTIIAFTAALAAEDAMNRRVEDSFAKIGPSVQQMQKQLKTGDVDAYRKSMSALADELNRVRSGNNKRTTEESQKLAAQGALAGLGGISSVLPLIRAQNDQKKFVSTLNTQLERQRELIVNLTPEQAKLSNKEFGKTLEAVGVPAAEVEKILASLRKEYRLNANVIEEEVDPAVKRFSENLEITVDDVVGFQKQIDTLSGSLSSAFDAIRGTDVLGGPNGIIGQLGGASLAVQQLLQDGTVTADELAGLATEMGLTGDAASELIADGIQFGNLYVAEIQKTKDAFKGLIPTVGGVFEELKSKADGVLPSYEDLLKGLQTKLEESAKATDNIATILRRGGTGILDIVKQAPTEAQAALVAAIASANDETFLKLEDQSRKTAEEIARQGQNQGIVAVGIVNGVVDTQVATLKAAQDALQKIATETRTKLSVEANLKPNAPGQRRLLLEDRNATTSASVATTGAEVTAAVAGVTTDVNNLLGTVPVAAKKANDDAVAGLRSLPQGITAATVPGLQTWTYDVAATTDTAANAFGSLAIRGVDAMQRLANGIETPAARIVEVVGSMAAAINAVSGQIGSGDTIVVPGITKKYIGARTGKVEVKHSGGVVGDGISSSRLNGPVASNEQLVLAQKGEGVVPVDAMKRLGLQQFRFIQKGDITGLLAAKDKVPGAKANVSGANDIGQVVAGGLGPVLGSAIGGAIDRLAKNVTKYLDEVSSLIDAKVGATPGLIPGGNIGGAGSGAAAGWIRAAMAITGAPESWFTGLMTLAKRESGFNPRAINNWDSNAAKGTPSIGLMQTIGPTFRAYALPGYTDIYNPVHNAIASIRYIRARYGDISRVQQANASKPPKGYYFGDLVTTEQTARVAEGGRAELILPIQSNPKRAEDLLAKYIFDPTVSGVNADSLIARLEKAVSNRKSDKQVTVADGGSLVTLQMQGESIESLMAQLGTRAGAIVSQILS